jgi:hypothetical protein
MLRHRVVLSLAVLAVLAFSPVLRAEVTTVSISSDDYSVISNPENFKDKNIILKFEVPRDLEGLDIHFAELTIKPSFSQIGRKHIGMAMFALASEVSLSTVSWSIWNNPESSIAFHRGAFEFLDTNVEDEVSFNLTHWIERCLDGDYSNYGFLVKTDSDEDEDLSLSTSENFPDGAVGIVTIYYEKQE